MENFTELIEKIKNPMIDELEKIRTLKLYRCQLLGEIHEKQQLLDNIDYLIIQLKGKYHL